MFVRRLLTLPYGGGSTLGPNMEIANDRRLKIGELARQTGLSIKTIRYYESRGLLEQPPRTEGGHGLSGPEEVARLRFVQRAKLRADAGGDQGAGVRLARAYPARAQRQGGRGKHPAQLHHGSIAVCNGIEPSLCRGSDGTVIVHHYVAHSRARPMVGGVGQLHRLPL
jgi:hypothetical protein